MPADEPLKPNPDVVFTIVDDKAILLEQASGKYYSLNPVGTRIWKLLETYGQLDKVYEQLLDEYNVDPERLRQNLDDSVKKLTENGLLA